MHDVDTVEQIASEGASGHELLNISVGRRDDPDVHPDRATHASDRLNLSTLEEPEEMGLHLQAHFRDLVEEDRAPVRRLEPPHAIAVGAGEASARVPEEFRFEEGVGDRRAVHRDEGAWCTRRVGVECTAQPRPCRRRSRP